MPLELARVPHETFDPEPWRGDLLSFLRRMGASHDAEDIVQETFLRTVTRPPQGSVKPWLFGIALNLLRDRVRRDGRSERARPTLVASQREAPVDPAIAVERNDLAARAQALTEELPERQRAALLLRVRHGFEYGEVAAALHCTEATARQHFYLALKVLRDRLRDGDDR